MKKKIVPAILTDKKRELAKMLNLCYEFTDFAQIDIMDGKFVPSKSVTPDDLLGLKVSISCEAHLMVQNPLDWLSAFKKIGCQQIIFHFEIKDDHLKIIESIRKNNFKVGIAINPATEIKDFEFLIDKVDTVLFMSVNPGFYGSAFIPQVLEKIKKFKEKYPGKIAGIDGGVKADNIKEVATSGVDYICIGSAILKASSPKDAYLKINKLLDD